MKLLATKGFFTLILAWSMAVSPSLALTTGPGLSVSPPPPHRDLLAIASDDRFWIAHFVRTPEGNAQTNLIVRSRWSGANDWTVMPSIAERVVSIATSNGELLAVLANGQWEIADENDIRTGPAPPQISQLLAIAGNSNRVWAVVRGIPWPATTVPSKPAQTAPSEPRLMVCRFLEGSWVTPCPLPDDVSDDPSLMSLAVVDQRPMLAWKAADGRLLVSNLTKRNHWTLPMDVASDVSDFKLLTIHDRPVLWLANSAASSSATRPQSSAAGAGEVLIGDDFTRRIPLAMPTAPPSRIVCQTLVAALGHLRWIAYAGDKQIEQDFSLEEFPNSFPPAKMSVLAPTVAPEVPLAPWILGDAVLVVAAAAVAGRQRSLTRAELARSSADQANIEKPHLAPIGTRFLAGLVDLAPILAVVAIVHPANSANQLAGIDPKSLETLSVLAAAAYALHTLAAELICGQSLGKMAFGLCVADTRGKPAKAGMIIVRNILRVIDVFLVLPLLMILISPLHQRTGDIAAGTVVIAHEGDAEEE